MEMEAVHSRWGFGGVTRNSNGEWVLGLSGSGGSNTNLHADLQAIRMGLLIAWDKLQRDSELDMFFGFSRWHHSRYIARELLSQICLQNSINC